MFVYPVQVKIEDDIKGSKTEIAIVYKTERDAIAEVERLIDNSNFCFGGEHGYSYFYNKQEVI
jgi:hypothetical protein